MPAHSARPVALEELVEQLEVLGLDRREALVYAHLLLRGASRASEAAQAADLPRTEVYRTLRQLMARGCAVARAESPTRFEAVPAESVFDQLENQLRGQQARLRETRASVLELLDRLRPQMRDDPASTAYRVLQGREVIYAAVEDLLRRAHVGQRMVSTYFAPGNATASNLLFQGTVDRAEAGLTMQLLLVEAPGFAQRLEPLVRQEGVEVRFFDPPCPMRFTIVDDREVVSWLGSDPSPRLTASEDVAIWTNAPGFVGSQRALFDALWDDARPVRPHGKP